MKTINVEATTHPTEETLATFLDNSLGDAEKERVIGHLAQCAGCRQTLIAARQALAQSGLTCATTNRVGKMLGNLKKGFSPYCAAAALSFGLSFLVPRYFLQFLVLASLFALKWIVDSKTTKMLVMIYDAWKQEGEHGVSRVIKRFDKEPSSRL